MSVIAQLLVSSTPPRQSKSEYQRSYTEATPGKPVAIAAINSLAVPQLDCVHYGRFLKQPRGLVDPTPGVDEGTDSRVGTTGHGNPIFHSANYGHRKVLVRCAAATVPSVVGNVDQQIGASANQIATEFREYSLVTNEHAYLRRRQFQYYSSISGGEIASRLYQLVYKKQ